ncbi:MAG TPA: DUF3011 domain-containing protein [Tahibacter sp.]|uniref:DUF3011 domain-containing protein n=1 Tax=Tahibacter sp. TaxID=2056211 RepID=UPI002D0E8FF4|nr:DUF3011 domain-containing protein [Tahibacter sp.]HSX59441.1 DUF3011 domain-containing protein [Tahibacter sp.]
MKGYVRSAACTAAIGLALAATGASAQRGDWDRDIEFQCESRSFSYNLCQVDTGRGGRVYLVDQVSNSECIEGRTWGYNRAGVWVDQGCAGIFRVERRGGGRHDGGRDDRYDDGRGDRYDDGRGDRHGDWRPGNDWDQRISVRCGSQNYHYNLCQVDTGRGSDVRIARQISGTACVEGRTWGWNRAGIWVDGGCEAIFTVDRRWR